MGCLIPICYRRSDGFLDAGKKRLAVGSSVKNCMIGPVSRKPKSVTGIIAQVGGEEKELSRPRTRLELKRNDRNRETCRSPTEWRNRERFLDIARIGRRDPC